MFSCTNAYALKADVAEPVNIQADAVEVNRTAGTAVYAGGVVIKQGTLEILAARVDISAPSGEIQTITAVGNPIQVKQKMDDGKLATGEGRQMIYQVSNKMLILSGNAKLTQDRDMVTSNRIEYSTSTGQLRAGAAPASEIGKQDPELRKKGRVSAVFYPSNKSQ